MTYFVLLFCDLKILIFDVYGYLALVNVTTKFDNHAFPCKFPYSMMFHYFNNLLNISMIFKKVLFDDFNSMLLSSLFLRTLLFWNIYLPYLYEKNYFSLILSVIGVHHLNQIENNLRFKWFI